MQTPDEWLADFERKVADLQQKATDFKRDIESAGTTRTSEDKSVTVTVAPNGALLDLQLTDAATGKPAAELAQEILRTARQARQSAANSVAEAFVPIGGDRDTVQRIDTPEEERPPAAPETDDYSENRIFGSEQQKW
ncbi:YbaB/EbfC family nucleoid-associated protein [Actinokineospora guangxiensis]|uniref:YbaB/EbfC family nucleoid-associated protein n=1 Tax=Actinokineospora guangxiensis TaxID=1490288 RepID=A0ABW0EJT9_9PSEU